MTQKKWLNVTLLIAGLAFLLYRLGATGGVPFFKVAAIIGAVALTYALLRNTALKPRTIIAGIIIVMATTHWLTVTNAWFQVMGNTMIYNWYYSKTELKAADLEVRVDEINAAAGAMRTNQKGVTTHETYLFDEQANTQGTLPKGTQLVGQVMPPYEATGPQFRLLVERAGSNELVRVRLLDKLGFPTGSEGFVVAAHFNSQGPDPVLGLDAHGRRTTKNPEEHIHKILLAGECYPPSDEEPLDVYNHGDELTTIFTEASFNSDKPYDRCTSTECITIRRGEKTYIGKVGVPFRYCGTRGTGSEIDITIRHTTNFERASGRGVWQRIKDFFA